VTEPHPAPHSLPPSGGRAPAPVRWLFMASRLVMFVGVLSLISGAVTLLVFGGVETARHIVKIVTPVGAGLTNREVFLASIKLVDLVLLATVLQVVAVALHSLFIGSDIPVPSWLLSAGIDGLKNLLAGIVAVMLGVLFLEQVITTAGSPDVLPLGIGIAAVIVALSYFIRSHPGGH
jgi:uncharacterized membrane protein YqhA